MNARFSRQARLPEIGEAGQLRLLGSVHAVRGAGLAAEVEARYARAAGFGRVDAGCGAPDPEPAWIRELHPGAREVALGAHRALSAIRGTVRQA